MAIDDGRGDIETIVLGEMSDRAQSRVTSPTLLVGLGGTGAEVLRRVKARTRWLGVSSWVKFLIIEAHQGTRMSPTPGLPDFDNEEFLFLDPQNSQVVFRNPSSHAELLGRFDLADSKSQEFAAVQRAAVRVDGAGQIRPAGALRCATNYQDVEGRVLDAVNNLRDRWTVLLGQANGTAEAPMLAMQQQLSVYVVGSLAGGTAAGTIVDIGVLLRAKLAEQGARITGVFALPEIFDKKLAGKQPEEKQRVRANSVAILRELCHVYRQPQSMLKEFPGIQPDIASPFTSMYLFGNYDSSGLYMGDSEDVFDHVAMNLTADAALSVRSRQDAADANDNVLNQIEGGQEEIRAFSTLSGIGASVPIVSFIVYCTHQQAYEFVSQGLLGSTPSHAEADRSAAVWLNSVNLNELGKEDQVYRRLSSGADAPPVEDLLKAGLFDGERADGALNCRKDSAFTATWDTCVGGFDAKVLKPFRDRLVKAAEATERSGKTKLEQEVTRRIRELGLREAGAFCARAGHSWRLSASEMGESESASKRTHDEHLSSAEALVDPLRKFPGSWGTDPTQQQKAFNAARDALDAGVREEICRAAARVMKQLAEHAATLERRLGGWVEHWEKQEKICDESRVSNQIPDNGWERTPGEGPGDTSVLTRRVAEQLYSLYKPGRADMVESLRRASGRDLSEWVTSEVRGKDRMHELRLAAMKHFVAKLRSEAQPLTFSQTLAMAKRAGGDQLDMVLARIKAAVLGCRPMWQIAMPRVDMKCADSLMVAIPKVEDADIQAEIQKILSECERVLKADSRYTSQLTLLESEDPLRMYVCRRSHGGSPTYLASWAKNMEIYSKWRGSDRPDYLHLFPPNVVDRMPDLRADDAAGAAQRAFSVGIALGLIARRGNNFYFNLEITGDGRFRLPLNTQEDGILFVDGKPRSDGKYPQAALFAKDSIEFGGQTKGESRSKLGASRADAFKEFSQVHDVVKHIDAVIDAWVEKCDRKPVAAELLAYAKAITEAGGRAGKLPASIKDERDSIERCAASLAGSR